MKTQELYKCIDFMWNWQFLTQEDHDELFRKGDMFGESHIEPVLRELEDNLFSKGHEERVEIITRYVRAFNRVSVQNELGRIEGEAGKVKRVGNVQFLFLKNNADNGDIYAHMIHNLYVLIFKEMDLTCRHFKIPFIKILQDLDIDLETLFFEPDEDSDINSDEDNSTKNPPDHEIIIKPTFKPEAIEIIFPILKDFFSPDQQDQLLEILKTGSIAKTKLIFFDNGIRLADLFRKLLEHDFIVRCGKDVLQQWIFQNFNFKFRNKISPYSLRTIEKYISTNEYPCKSPLINIEKGEIIKVISPHYKKYNN